MHVDEINRKIERAHQKLLRAKTRLEKLQGRLAHTPVVGRTPAKNCTSEWMKTLAMGAFGWSGPPFKAIFSFIDRLLPLPHEVNAKPAQPDPTSTSRPQGMWTFGRRAR
jgi:hypothetical protein